MQGIILISGAYIGALTAAAGWSIFSSWQAWAIILSWNALVIPLALWRK